MAAVYHCGKLNFIFNLLDEQIQEIIMLSTWIRLSIRRSSKNNYSVPYRFFLTDSYSSTIPPFQAVLTYRFWISSESIATKVFFFK